MPHCNSRFHLLPPLALTLSSACRATPPAHTNTSRDAQSTAQRTRDTSTVSPRQESATAPTSEARAAITAALASQNVHAAVVVDSSLDVDHDGAADVLFHTESPARYGMARSHQNHWRVDLLERQTGPFETISWGPAIAFDSGGAVLLVRNARETAAGPVQNQALEVLTVRPGEAPTLGWSDVSPVEASWSLQTTPDGSITLSGMASPRSSLDPGLNISLKRISPTRLGYAGCWGQQQHAVREDSRRCTVAVPAGARERRWERIDFGPPFDPGARVTLLYQGTPLERHQGTQNWCVLTAFDIARWVALPAALTARCAPDGGAH